MLPGTDQFDALSDTAEYVSGELEEYNDPDTSANVIGSGPELGGQYAPVSTYDPHTDGDVINLTGMTESAMLPTDAPISQTINPAGTGGAPQQVASIVPDPTRLNATSNLIRSGGNVGQAIAQNTLAPQPAQTTLPPALTQTTQRGISLHANLVLFFILGATLGVIALSYMD